MKYLEIPELAYLNSELRSNLVDSKIIGKVELYSSGKQVGEKTDKAIVTTSGDVPSSPEILVESALSKSPVGSLTDSANRKVLINLICTLNASFPDYDFSNLKPEDFQKERNLRQVINTINASLAEAFEKNGNGLCERLWNTIYEVIDPEECSIYSYIPDLDGDPFSDGNIWSFNYFFYNKRRRKVLFFTCSSKSKHHGEGTDEASSGGDLSDDEDRMDDEESSYYDPEDMDD
mmetsp:Transcript_23004/g.37846  ORF Transcript_23004/g.37846 Transcript_23004/m.37846 type:complete len:233 (+) Transcript_23004:133-831(+)|eukprot:CAMPEP_0184655938 /NCGR_PEP_ID=MMETSP0308-20130426/14981_1 /TAXON_ID=38269 /ORGANISM="Gloeochaete witrockiana, Strain SAG 46.84" /LENGTH=232 /DNA_ID=CAMNT_0027092767 /DNA_START=109 /DNA_END=807 /DNA_ORIENTATION=-